MMNILDFKKKKEAAEKICMITCYDYTSARILSNTLIDCILVGDSLAMTMYGFQNTLSATLTMMQLHTGAVSRGAPNKFIITDLPFLSFRKSLSKTVSAAETLIRNGAQALKIEGAAGNLKIIRHLVESGVPMMGHLGFTMQYMHTLGNTIVQGKTEAHAKRLQEEALLLQDAGCFAVVLECMPTQLAKTISENLIIPTIGIGAGPHTDGQVLVFQDVLGLNIDFKPKFVKNFTDGYAQHKQSLDAFAHAIKLGVFPQDENCYQSS
ncbi:MAG: 3-methyl-2-oxobutanoate hydroxymethyltransferase [Gammaproteobacteria bacterium RIFCSPHIGHO2_12_FULL_42_10]|nr:MAG: 3-methyl-2-oxobutanoate hydroxymethyltransferase [Gammaproteobacteria bacterium RIFCSPHIGHO2_12_FULL_42_10]